MRCGVYIRVSTDRDEQKDSLDNQKNYFLNYIQENDYTLYKIYQDVASGTSTKNRNGYLQLVEDIKNNKIDLVLTKEIARLSRSMIDTGSFTELCAEKDVGIKAINNGIDTLTSNPQFMGLYSFLAQYEDENSSLRIKTALNTIAKSGFYKGSIAPYGYNIINKVLVVRDDYTPDIVKRIYREYQEGKGVDTIARHLTGDNIPTPAQVANKKNAGVFWSGKTVQLILSNRNYTGDLTQCKSTVTSIRTKKRKQINPEDFVIVPNTHEAIILRAEFEFVQELLNTRSRKQNNNRKSTHLFSNLLFCADCGKGMHFKKNRHGYVCGNFDKNGKFGGCTSHIIRESILEEIILNDIKVISKQFKNNYSTKLNLKINQEILIIKKNLDSYENKVKSLNTTKKNALFKFCSEEITDSEYRDLIDYIEKELKSINITINQLNTKLEKLNTLTSEDLTELTNELSNIKMLNKELLNRLIKKIEVKENGDVKIYYRFSHLLSTY